MQTNDKNFNEAQSLDLIHRMIETAKQQIDDDSFYFLLWGWLVFIASLSNFVLDQMGTGLGGWGWVFLMPLGGIVTMIYSAREKKKRNVKTYTDEIMKYVLISFGVSLAIVLGSQAFLQMNTYPMVLIVYGAWLFSAGGALKFRPLMAGGIINWTLAVASFFSNFEIQLLLLAAAVLLGYIIPGYMLKAKYKASATQTA
jgi:hypothetical protein